MGSLLWRCHHVSNRTSILCHGKASQRVPARAGLQGPHHAQHRRIGKDRKKM